MRLTAIIIFIVLLLDQILKIYIKTHFFLGEEYKIFDWFLIHFTENPGMAFGFELGGVSGKIFLTLFRIIFSVAGIIYLYQYSKKNTVHTGFFICAGLVLGGAIGNVLDSIFYGMVFSDSTFQVATWVPWGTGYAQFLQGHVVDMFYFPLIEGHFPAWVPFWGGEHFIFFRPVFNIADSSISVGIVLFLLFQKRWFGNS